MDFIHIKGARVNNLKNIEVKIPRGQFVVITGLSGSGKSSLAFDTLYAEGQRRYVESLSAYARQFLGRMQKPEVDFIRGIPPAIAIEQKVSTRNARSTVGTSTEIYDYLKLLFARVGKTFSPISGCLVQKHRPQDVVNFAMQQPQGTRMILFAPLAERTDRTMQQHLELLAGQGFSRLQVNDELVRIQEITEGKRPLQAGDRLRLMIDRIVADGEASTANRFTDSLETAFFEGDGSCILQVFDENGPHEHYFSDRFEADGMTFELPSRHLFDFNNPLGACPTCEGFGSIVGIDPDLVVPNKSLSIYQEAIACWRGEKMSLWNKELIAKAGKFHFPIHKPYYELTPEQKQLLWTGNKYFRGLNDFFRMLEEKAYAKIQYRVMLARYRGKTVCPACGGARLRKEANYVKFGGKSISELVCLPVTQLLDFFRQVPLDPTEKPAAQRLLHEITSRLQFLADVGLGYLTLNRLSNTLSGGESQRINLATSLGSSLVGSLYILDEPSIGLHPRDTQRLVSVLKQLRDLGNTVVVVEHDEEIMRAADHIIDIGPEAGRHGGRVVLDMPVRDIHTATAEQQEQSHTLAYLTGREKIETPPLRRQWNNYIEITGACQNNLKNLNVKFPLNVLTVVTGVSGSGKSSLVRQIFYNALKKHYGGHAEQSGTYNTLSGSMHLAKDIEIVDQNPIGRSSRSNPVTYIKAYDEIRKLFADQPLSKQMGYTAAYFSFNTPGGRCEECQGEGTVTVEMQFMADLVLECEHCRGKRFKPDTLEVMYKGRNIHDVLNMTVNQAVEFFGQGTTGTEKKIVGKLKPLQDVGIGYIKLGQSSSTLSGGESQRVKLASILAAEKASPTIFIFDEPTTGLHFHDIKTLMHALNALVDRGHTVIIIEHNPEVIKCADHVIDLGPEGGEAGGRLVFEGTPEALARCPDSHTGQTLRL